MTEPSRLQQALNAVDAANAEDPNQVTVDGAPLPKELVYGQRMSACLETFAPDASELLQIACRAQHICRWVIPRDRFPMGRAGYYKWRTSLGVYHADKAASLISDLGYSSKELDRLKAILRKESIKKDDEVQVLEDVACLVFMEHYLEPFAEGRDEDHLIRIIKKTWGKMSEAGQAAALQLPLGPEMTSLVAKALACN